jgi:hypothetical protein
LLATPGSQVHVFTASPFDPHRWTHSTHALACTNAAIVAGQQYFAHLDRSRLEVTILNVRRDGTVVPTRKSVGFDCRELILEMCGGEDYVAVIAVDPVAKTEAVLRVIAAGDERDTGNGLISSPGTTYPGSPQGTTTSMGAVQGASSCSRRAASSWSP